MAPLEVPELEQSRFKNFFTFTSVNAIAFFVLAAAIVVLFLWESPPWDIVLVSSLSTLIVLWFIVFFTARRIFIREVSKTFAGGQLPEILKDFKVLMRIPIYILVYLVKLRGLSVIKMVMDVFLRRIRRLQLDALFAEVAWKGRVQTNNLYTLQGKHLNDVGAKIQRVVASANTMPTTLWFSEKDKKNHLLDDLIACGQFSLCYNLISYCKEIKEKTYEGENIWENTPPEAREEIETLQAILEGFWDRFRQEPYWLLNQDKEGAGTLDAG